MALRRMSPCPWRWPERTGSPHSCCHQQPPRGATGDWHLGNGGRRAALSDQDNITAHFDLPWIRPSAGLASTVMDLHVLPSPEQKHYMIEKWLWNTASGSVLPLFCEKCHARVLAKRHCPPFSYNGSVVLFSAFTAGRIIVFHPRTASVAGTPWGGHRNNEGFHSDIDIIQDYNS